MKLLLVFLWLIFPFSQTALALHYKNNSVHVQHLMYRSAIVPSAVKVCDSNKNIYQPMTVGHITAPAIYLHIGNKLKFNQITVKSGSYLYFLIASKTGSADLIVKLTFADKVLSSKVKVKANEFVPVKIPFYEKISSKNFELILEFDGTNEGERSTFAGCYIGSPVIIEKYATATRPDIFLITVDTLSAMHISSYGYKYKTTPFFDSIVHEGVMFKYTYSASPWTRPSYASMLTGLPLSSHKVTTSNSVIKGGMVGKEVLNENMITLPEALRSMGYLTIGIYTVGNLHPDFGFSQGFDIYINVPEMTQDNKFRSKTASYSADRWTQIVKDFGDVQKFLFVNIIDPHTPYMPPSTYSASFYEGKNSTLPEKINIGGGCDHCDMPFDVSMIRALYDGEIAYTDNQLKRMISAIKQYANYDKSIVIVTADHGEELGEHHGWGHGFHLFEEQVRVPLWIRYNGYLPAGKTVTKPVSLTSIFPTILDLLEYPFDPNQFSALSLVEAIECNGEYSPVIIEILNHDKADEAQRAIVDDRYKLIHYLGTNNYYFYDLIRDPLEISPIKDDSLSSYKRLLMGLKKFETRISPIRESHGLLSNKKKSATKWLGNKKLINELKELGYIK